MAIAFTKTGQPEEAIRHYKRALELDDSLVRRPLRRRLPAAQAGRRAAGGRAPARLSRAAAQGPRRRALGPPRRDARCATSPAARPRRRCEAAGRSAARWSRRLGCSGLTKAKAAWWRSRSRCPDPDTVEVGETIQLSARPLDTDGDSVDAADHLAGRPTPRSRVDAPPALRHRREPRHRPGAGRGRARSARDPVTFTVIAPADTLVIVGRLGPHRRHRRDAAGRRHLVTVGSTASLPPGRSPDRGR